MHAIAIDGDRLTWTPAPDPAPGPDEVVIRVAAAGINRADLLQRKGQYPPPPGASEVLGMECSGVIDAVGADVGRWRVGDEVCALLAGGGYAERVAVPAVQVLPVPGGVDLIDAAGLPEVACTVWSTVVMAGRAQRGETLLVHGGTGGIGTFAIQLGVALGLRVMVTAGSAAGRQRCLDLGAERVVDYHDEDFVEVARELTDGRGVDVVLDVIGAKYLQRNVSALATLGRLTIIGMQGGAKAELDLGALLTKRATVLGTTLRSRPVTGRGSKADIVAEVEHQVWPLVASGAIRPVIGARMPITEAAAAHAALDSGSAPGGKVLLTVP
ncbi:NAD(P)H-quinone oxidoreductase [Nakamurella deserti]|uniref:NAD(P)H-quinone oxidoreductase n=1 Tax=Nakamurella deserti TaxID=2164074 RepID=UPI000DBE4C8E|nr:NAD(P)H-quinone oxidoreductase [Nakamurella deserti]